MDRITLHIQLKNILKHLVKEKGELMTLIKKNYLVNLGYITCSSRHVLAMMKNKIPPKEMQALRSQSHQKRKIKKILKSFPVFSKAPSTMKVVARKEIMTNKNMILLTIMSLEESFHQEYLSQHDTKISLLVVVFLAIILVIK
jgi:hypothetical protein